MDKSISADKLFQALRDDYNIPGACLARVKRHIDAAPAVDAVPVVHARWLYDSCSGKYFCSACNENALSVITQEQVEDYDWEENLVSRLESVTKEFWTDYCPNCGAVMDGGNDNE